MAVADGQRILVYRDLGLVSQVFDEGTLATLQGHLCVGHTRYSTTGSTTWENAQPTFKSNGRSGLALGHNGNLVNTAGLAAEAGTRGRASTDSDVVATLLSRRNTNAPTSISRVQRSTTPGSATRCSPAAIRW